jgi:hypothetical protein
MGPNSEASTDMIEIWPLGPGGVRSKRRRGESAAALSNERTSENTACIGEASVDEAPNKFEVSRKTCNGGKAWF